MLDARAVAAVDPGGMREIIASLPDQLSAGMKVGESTRVPIEEAQRIFIVGMGGSAIGGDVFASWIADRAKVPIQVVRDYRIPAYGRPEDLLIAVSYSGNTEETLAATTQGLKLGCRVVAITSGGTLRDLARANDMRVLPVPTGLPPRGAFGHLFGILSGIGGEWAVGNLTDELGQAINHLRSLRKALRPESAVRSNRAKSLALRIRSTRSPAAGRRSSMRTRRSSRFRRPSRRPTTTSSSDGSRTPAPGRTARSSSETATKRRTSDASSTSRSPSCPARRKWSRSTMRDRRS